MNLPTDRQSLIQRVEAGESFDYFFFYGHKQKGADVDSSCLSQWFPASFEIDGQAYPTAEHWMMACKARLFGDAALKSIQPEEPQPEDLVFHCGSSRPNEQF